MRILYRKKLGPTFTPINYGLLYSGQVIKDARGIAPAGWHAATRADVNTLLTFLGAAANRFITMREPGLTHWDTDPGVSDLYGFSARGGGFRIYNTGAFSGLKNYCDIWALNGVVNPYLLEINPNGTYSFQQPFLNNGASIRYVKNDANYVDSVTDYDGNVYPTCNINGQIWSATAIKVQHFNNGEAIPVETNAAAWAALNSSALCAYNNDWLNV